MFRVGWRKSLKGSMTPDSKTTHHYQSDSDNHFTESVSSRLKATTSNSNTMMPHRHTQYTELVNTDTKTVFIPTQSH